MKFCTKKSCWPKCRMKKFHLVINSAKSRIRDSDKKKWIMRANVTTLLLIVSIMQVSANSFAQKITLNQKNISLREFFREIRKQTGYNVFYSEQKINDSKRLDVHFENTPVEEALTESLKQRSLSFKIYDKDIVIKPLEKNLLERITGYLSTIDVSGKVTDENGRYLAGASVKVKGTNTTINTNARGEFTLNGLKEDAVLVISYVGYDILEITVKELKINGQVVLKENVGKLDETVVIGYGTTTQRLNTGSVSRVTAKEIEQQPVANVLLAMQGRVPGLTITPVNGLPGAAVKVQLRGKNSLFNGSDPLFILDGVPMASGNNGITSGSMASTFTWYGSEDIDAVSPFSMINPDDIESIDILKDADATSIYGSRGANGVILITTKKGKAGKTEVRASISSGISQSTKIPKMLNTKEYLKMRKQAFENDGITPTTLNAYDLLVWDTTRNTNWQKLLLGNTAHSTDANVSVNGGDKNTQFLIGSGYHHDGTVLLGNGYNNRVSFNSNLNHQSYNGRFSMNLSTLYSSNNINMPQGQSLTQLPPNAPPLYDEAGQINWGPPGGPFNNPIALIKNRYEVKSDNLLSSLQLMYSITTDLKIKTGMGYNSISSNEISLFPQIAVNPNTSGTLTGSSNFANTGFKSWSVEPQLEYNKKVLGGHLSALLGGSWQKIQNNSTNISASGYTNDALIRSLAAAPVTSTNNKYSEYKYAAMFGRINYNLNDKYLLNISGRRDGSSRFGPGNRYSNFGAVGIGWIISNENFVKNQIPFLSFAKIRGSYGTTGNDQIGDYKYLDAWSTIYQLPYQGTTTLMPEGLFNPSYNWERNKKLEGALELGLWNNRLLTTLAYFRNRCDNQLILYNLPAQTGFSNITANLPALIQNSGFEISLSGDIVSAKNFKWNISANITIPKNKLLSFPDLLTSPYATDYKTGQSINVINGYRSSGINDKGIYTFRDVNGDNILDVNDLLPIASLDPKYYGGVGNHFSYKGIELDIFFEFKNKEGKNYLASMYSNRKGSPGFINNQPAEILGSKEVQNFTTSTSSAAFRQLGYLTASDVIYSNASYIRLKNLSLSYNLSSILKSQLKMRVFLLGQNLFTITKYKVTDPETQGLQTLPPLRTLTAGLQVTL